MAAQTVASTPGDGLADAPYRVPPSASHPTTNRVAFDLIAPLVRPGARILDFGAGRGHMTARLANRIVSVGGRPGDGLVSCDHDAGSFEVAGLDCTPVTWIDRLPWPDNHFDAACSIEVIEHLENPWAFVREMLRVMKPGGKLVLTTPNPHHMMSRAGTLFRGYPTMFGLVTFRHGDEGDWLGHVSPIVWTTLHACLYRAGARDIRRHVDRRKKSAVALALAAWPWIALATTLYRRDLAAGDPARRAAEAEFGDALSAMASFDMLTSRSLVVEATAGGA